MLSKSDYSLAKQIRVKLITDMLPLNLIKEFFTVADNNITVTKKGLAELKISENFTWNNDPVVFFTYKNLIDFSLSEAYDFILTGKFNFNMKKDKYIQIKLKGNSYIMKNAQQEAKPEINTIKEVIKRVVIYDQVTGDLRIKPEIKYQNVFYKDIFIKKVETGETFLNINGLMFRVENIIWFITMGQMGNNISFIDGDKTNFKFNNLKATYTLPKGIKFNEKTSTFSVKYKYCLKTVEQTRIKTLPKAKSILAKIKNDLHQEFAPELTKRSKKSKKR